MYMSLNGDHWGSSIVCLTAKSPEGPWTYQGPVVFSGFQGTFEHNGLLLQKTGSILTWRLQQEKRLCRSVIMWGQLGKLLA